MRGFTDALKGVGGGYEINRVVGAFGGFVYVVAAHGFVIAELVMGRGFDLGEYCTWFPLGLAAVVGGTAGAVALKDRAVAASKVMEATGSKPANPPDPAPQVQPELVAATEPAIDVDDRPEYAR